MCIDYRVVNGFIKLSNYPLPLIDDLLIGFATTMWFMSHDMTSGFWAVTMTERAKLISAFAVSKNCLWGFVIPPEEEKLVDPDVLEFLGVDVKERGESEREKSGSKVPVLTDVMTVSNATYRHLPRWDWSLDGARTSTISLMGLQPATNCAPTWTLLFRLRYWNITGSLLKIEFGKLTIPVRSTWSGVTQPVRFTGRVLNDCDVRYHIDEKEVVAIMISPEVSRTIVENSHFVIYNRYHVLSWLMKSKSADRRCVRWGLTLSHWDLEVRKGQRDADGLDAILGAGITPREHLDEVAETLIPAKG
ncbi:unnamed protein product [Phytophthora fragariaefolia]|uniref:Unnamed protein product n=1 Tax=Phytophthora fragariaefolia TaxID=1490495 RepID=A0A9W6TL69_9STRA|nr:unnamed protein product [Phytophthora fragariaefolia]